MNVSVQLAMLQLYKFDLDNLFDTVLITLDAALLSVAHSRSEPPLIRLVRPPPMSLILCRYRDKIGQCVESAKLIINYTSFRKKLQDGDDKFKSNQIKSNQINLPTQNMKEKTDKKTRSKAK